MTPRAYTDIERAAWMPKLMPVVNAADDAALRQAVADHITDLVAAVAAACDCAFAAVNNLDHGLFLDLLADVLAANADALRAEVPGLLSGDHGAH